MSQKGPCLQKKSISFALCIKWWFKILVLPSSKEIGSDKYIIYPVVKQVMAVTGGIQVDLFSRRHVLECRVMSPGLVDGKDGRICPSSPLYHSGDIIQLHVLLD